MTNAKFRCTVFENIGAASMCWSEVPKGVFDSSRAEKLAMEIVEEHETQLTIQINRAEELIKEFIEGLDSDGHSPNVDSTCPLCIYAGEALKKYRGEK